MTCLVCNHPNRFRLEAALKSGTPKSRVAKEFLVSRPKLYDHIRERHEQKNPAKPSQVQDVEPDREREDPRPAEEIIRSLTTKRERLAHVERILADRQYEGTKTIARLSRIWRKELGDEAELKVAEMVAEAARRHRILRGPKDVRNELLIVEILSLKEKCTNSGDYKTAASLLAQFAERDGLKDDPSLDRAVLVQIVQLIKHEAPHLERRVEEHLAQFEIVVDRAKAVLEGEIPPQMPLLPHAEEPMQEAPPTPRSNEAQSESGIDTGSPHSDSTHDVPS